jgi:sugar O-acyltransferase (sialic acid O-acetyltransferase NeuD family)
MKKAIIGAGAFAREIKAQLGNPETKCFVDDNYWIENNEFIFPLSEFNPEEYEIVIAIADPRVRFEIAQKLPKETKYFTFIHPSVIMVGDDISIGKGSIICAGCILSLNTTIGEHAHLNIQTTIGHDCTIGDFFTTAPGVKVSGNCRIYDLVYIGTNASIKEKISIHSLTTIGLNAGVIKHIEEPGVYVGTPAGKIKNDTYIISPYK